MKTKKTGKTMRVAGLLLALVLVTSCFVGGTFAKYVTSGTGADHAKVAMWGVKVTAHGEGDIFADKYDQIAGKDDTVAVAGGKYKVIAPGTKKEDAAVVTLSGTPEVAVKVTYNADSFALTGKWEYKYTDDRGTEHTEFYCPLTFKITGMINGVKETKTINCMGDGMNSVKDVQDAVKAAVASFSETYAPNTDLSTMGGNGLKISWEWPFEGGASSKQTDVKDTYLGDLATATDTASHDTIPAVYVVVTATVTQVD